MTGIHSTSAATLMLIMLLLLGCGNLDQPSNNDGITYVGRVTENVSAQVIESMIVSDMASESYQVVEKSRDELQLLTGRDNVFHIFIYSDKPVGADTLLFSVGNIANRGQIFVTTAGIPRRKKLEAAAVNKLMTVLAEEGVNWTQPSL